MDSRLLPWLAVVGWLCLTLGLWGWVGVAAWWVWPLSAGVGLLLAAAGYGWAYVLQLRAARPRTVPEEVAT